MALLSFLLAFVTLGWSCPLGTWNNTLVSSNGTITICQACSHGGEDGIYLCTDGQFETGTICNGTGKLDTQTCASCTQVYACSSNISCTDGNNTRCDACFQGYFLHKGAEMNADQCMQCEPLPACSSLITCSNSGDSACTQCIPGFYLTAGTCSVCSPVAGCSSIVTCTSSGDSKCLSSCIPGYYLDPLASLCTGCNVITGCRSLVTCTNSFNSECSECENGYYLEKSTVASDRCIGCSTIANCFSSVSCTSALDSTCMVCNNGFALVSSSPSRCDLITNCTYAKWSDWTECTSCSGGVAMRTRDMSSANTALPSMCTSQLFEKITCGYPCEDDSISGGEAAILYLFTSYVQWDWLQNQLSQEGVTLLDLSKTSRSITIVIASSSLKRSVTNTACQKDNITKTVASMALSVAFKNLPNVPTATFLPPVITSNSSIDACQILLTLSDPSTFPLGAVIGSVFGILLVLVGTVIVVLFWWRRAKWLGFLPAPLREHWLVPKDKSWSKEGNLYYKLIKPDSKLFEDFKSVWSMVEPNQEIQVDEVYHLNNTVLAAGFANYLEILTNRILNSPALFGSSRWALSGDEQDISLRDYVMSHFKSICRAYPWNTNKGVWEQNDVVTPLIYCAHGTDFEIGLAIAQNGFASLSTLDSGFYGKGIYTTTHAIYTLPYCNTKRTPSIMLCLANPGNPYPTTEHPHTPAEKSLKGQAILSGFQSHYVVVNKGGFPIKNQVEENEFNELVVGQESQLVPLYLVKLKGPKKKLAKLWSSKPTQYMTSSSTSYHQGKRRSEEEYRDADAVPLNPIW